MSHGERVNRLKEELNRGNGHFLSSGEHHSNTTRANRYKKGKKGLDLSLFNEVLSVDEKEHVVWVEPRVTMEQLVKTTLPYGLVPAVVPEFRGITVGGAIAGGAIESSSFLHGQWNDCCLSYEVLTGDGRVLEVSRDEHADLFEGIAGSYGSLGVILSAKIKLIPVKEGVLLHYHRFSVLSEALEFLEEQRKKSWDFLEGLVFDQEQITVICGEVADRPRWIKRFSVGRFSMKHFWSQWYYLHVQKTKKSCEWISFQEYLFRHDRGAFWMGSYFRHLKIISKFWLERWLPVPQFLSRWLTPESGERKVPGLFWRFLVGYWMDSQSLYHLYHTNSEGWFSKYFIVQDSYIPSKQALSFIESVLERLKITPIWLCPVKPTEGDQLFSAHVSATQEPLLNVGVYGFPYCLGGKEATRYFEGLTRSSGGKKMLYAHSYYGIDEFWEIYPKKEYDTLRGRYGSEGVFCDITEKVLSE